MDFIVERVQSAPALQRAGRRRVDRAPGAPVDARRPLGRASPVARRSRFVVRRFTFEALPAVRRASV
ncbi:Sir2 family transcriptional regulator [Burkholderia pseudomallei MSHR1043]|nr:Sir2 family transcriptional regulator [Burkholderia pseudomallei MSHR1043]